MDRKPFSRRKFLLGTAALAAAPAVAQAQQGYPQYPPQAPQPYPGQPYPPQQQPYYPGQQQPLPPGSVQPGGAMQGGPQGGQQGSQVPMRVSPDAQPADNHPVYGQPIQAPDGQDWYIGEIPDGNFTIRKVNQDLLNPDFRRQLVTYSHTEQPGSLVIDPRQHFLYLLREGNTAVRYGVGVGREGFGWSGVATVGRTAVWPDWVPPKEMRLRQPELPERMPGGPNNPLGARALYLYQGNKDTLYRIHGTAEPWTIGTNVSSGCIRLLNEEIADLYLRTPVNTRVLVL
ncbi:MAG TPA: L,D-transpeptidase [Xanthobacteraceae bacterium]|nr:L,D-transpeptidase [Xanthobacteraceae bacterium]